MFNFLNLITNNYFLKQKLKINPVNSPVRRLTNNWQGNIIFGENIVKGKFNTKKISDFQKFNFLRDLKSEGSIKARSIARSLVNEWINEHTNLQSKVFDSEVMAERITCWSFNYSWFGESGDLEFQKKVLGSIALQAKYLELRLNQSNDHLEKIIVIKGILVSKSILYETIDNVDQLLSIISEKVKILTNADGGHKSRSIVKQLNLLRHLVEIRSIIAILKNVTAEDLHNQTIVMGQFCRSFQMPDENFAWFHGGSLVEKDLIKQTLNRIGYKNRIFNIAKDSGYCRLSHNDTVLFADIGLNEKISPDTKASLFAFELFYKKQKLISNLGEITNHNVKSMNNSLASTAAHSTLNIDDRNNIDLTGKRKTKVFDVELVKIKNGNLLNMSHSGYETLFGVYHKRQINLSNEKGEIRGTDEILNIGNIGSIPKNAYIRFHLYQGIEPIRTRNGSVLLNHQKGFIWKMSSNNNNIRIENSVIFTPNGPKPCKELCIILNLEKIRAYKSISCNWIFELQE